MHVPLPRDQFAEFRDDLTGGDAKAVRRATRFAVDDGKLAEVTMGISDDQMDALLRRIITSWNVTPASGGAPMALPMADPDVLDEVPLDTYQALTEAAQPILDQINKSTGKSTSGSEPPSSATSSTAIVRGSLVE